MTPPPHQDPTASNPPVSPHNSSTPLISTHQQQDIRQAEPASEANTDEEDPKTGKRKFFGLGKKEDKQAMDGPPAAGGLLPHTQAAIASMRPSSPLKNQRQHESRSNAPTIPLSPGHHPHQATAAASPSHLRSSSPRLHSPASSEIFERNVQEPIPISTLGGELSPAHIPAHVMTEDSIPPALEASAEAITSNNLNPDEVEIVTSSSHQPASTILEPSASHADLAPLHSPSHPTLQHQNSGESEPASSLHHSGIVPGVDDDRASTYGQLDPNDVRRLSFISFKDIVQNEHQQMAASGLAEVGSRDSLHIGSFSPTAMSERAASPLRSPRSPTSTHSHSLSGGVATPPPGVNVNPVAANPEQSPVRSVGIGSPGLQHGELTIETMRQALRKTASGDLSGARSSGMSPVSNDETSLRDAPRSRTNTELSR